MPKLKITRIQGEVVVAICDAKLLGKEFKKGKFKLRICESFYNGEDASIGECLDAMREATIANLVGSIVKEAIKVGLIDPANVIKIQNVLHAQFVKF